MLILHSFQKRRGGNSNYAGRRPSGVYLSTAEGSSRDNLANLLLRKPGLQFKLFQHVWAYCFPQLRRRNVLIGPCADPGLSYVTAAILIEFLQQLADPSLKQSANSGPAEHARKIAEQPTKRLLRTRGF